MKLPEIQRSAAGMANTITPSQAMAPHIAKSRFFGEVEDMAQNVLEMKRQHDVRETTALNAESVSQFKRDMAIRTDPFTQDELDEYGISDRVSVDDATGTAEKWRVYPILLDQKLSEFRDTYGQNIKSASHRSKWLDEVDRANRNELERSVQDAANMAVKDTAVASVTKANSAVEAGYYDVARAQYELPIWESTPELKAKKASALDKIRDAEFASEMSAELEAELEFAQDTGDYSALDDIEARHRDKENIAGTPWTEAEHTAYADRIAATKVTLENRARVNNDRAKKDRMDAHWQRYYQTPALLLANMPADATATDIRAITSFAKKTSGGDSIKTDYPTWEMLNTMAAEEPDRFAETSLVQYADRLTTADLKSFNKMQLEANDAKNGGNPPSYLSNESVMSLGITQMGLKPTGGSASQQAIVYQTKTLFATELEAAEVAKGEKLTTAEKEKIITDITLYEIKNSKGIVSKARAIEKNTDPQILAAAAETISGYGRPVTGDYIDAYEALLDDDLEINQTTLDGASWLIRNGKMVSKESLTSLEKRRQEALQGG